MSDIPSDLVQKTPLLEDGGVRGFESVANTSSSGVISGVGKGIIASSCGLLLKTLGLTVSSIKVDPYLNIDAGLMSYVLATALFSRASC